jgi:hypothetical protein
MIEPASSARRLSVSQLRAEQPRAQFKFYVAILPASQ